MKRQAYLRAGRMVGPLYILCLKLYSKLTGRPRVRILVVNEYHEILLLKNVISHHKWSLPGGGMNRHETAVKAARRELHEETGMTMPESSFHYIRTLEKIEDEVAFQVPLFLLTVQKSALPPGLVNPREIAEIEWFDKSHLPADLSSIAIMAIKELD